MIDIPPEEIPLRNRMQEFAPKLHRLHEIEQQLFTERSKFEVWFAKKYDDKIKEAASLREELEKLRSWFNAEMSRLYYEGHEEFFDGSVQPRPIVKVTYDDEEKFKEWASQFPESYNVDTHAEPLKRVVRYLIQQKRLDLMTVDVKKAEKLAASTYEDQTPVLEGPFKVIPTVTQTSEEKLIKVITTLNIEAEFDAQRMTQPTTIYEDLPEVDSE